VTGSGYLLSLGDDALIAAQRMTQWCASAPELEEDIALANIALDLLGQARALLSYAGAREGAGRDEDALAFLRDPEEFGNVQLVELPNGDFAVTIAKLLFFSVYQELLYDGLLRSRDSALAGIAGKAVKECAYHVDHAVCWTLRLGDGTAQSHARMSRAVDIIWPYTHALFIADAATAAQAACGVGVDPATLRAPWLDRVRPVFTEAGLDLPEGDWVPLHGRRGEHTESFGLLLTQMQALHRAYPGARW